MRRFKKRSSFSLFFIFILQANLLVCSSAYSEGVTLPATGVWNSFNKHLNVLECNNISSKAISLNVKILNNANETITNRTLNLHGLGTAHLLLTDFVMDDAYGTYLITRTSGANGADIKINCLTAIYRLSAPDANKEVEYAYALPVRAPLIGESFGVYNSMNPEGGNAQPVFNWLSVVNSSSSPLSAKVRVYKEDGALDSEATFQITNLPRGARKDFALGHPQGKKVGLYRITPTNLAQPYDAFLTRFSKKGSLYNFAFPLRALPGSCGAGPIPASTMGNASNWGEIANPLGLSVTANIKVRNRLGTVIHSASQVIAPRSQYHLYLNQFLGPNNVGSFEVTCSAPKRVLVQSLFYGHRTQSSPLIEWAYASQATGFHGTINDTIASSVNTFLGAADWHKLFDLSQSSTQLVTRIYDPQGDALSPDSLTLQTAGALDIGIHETTGQNFYGLSLTRALTPSAEYSSELLRVFSNTVGGIGYIMNIQDGIFVTASGDSPLDNQAPLVSAGPNQTVTFPASVALNGTITDDGLPEGANVTKSWSKVSGPGTVTFGNSAATDTTVNFSVAGTYLLRLTASDSALSASDDVTITVTSSDIPSTPCTYVVSPSGNDSNPGTEALPWRTISKANNIVTKNQTVCVKAGVYKETIAPVNTGEEGKPIIYRPFSGDECHGPRGEIKTDDTPGDPHGKCRVRLDGSRTISGAWTRCSSQSACGNSPSWQDIYYIDLPNGLTTGISKDWLFDGGTRLQYASDPNQTNEHFTWTEMATPQQFTTTSLKLRADHAGRANGFWTGGYVKFKDEFSDKYYRQINSYSGGSITFNALPSSVVEFNRYILLNHLALLDQPGEFVIDYSRAPQRLYVMTTNRQSPASHTIAITDLTSAVDVFGRDYIRVEGFDISKFKGDEIVYISSHSDNPSVMTGIQIVNNFIHDNGDGEGLGVGTSIHARGADKTENLLIENNEMSGTYGTSIAFGSNGATISWNNVHNAGDAMRAGGRDVVVEYNHFYDCYDTDGHQDGLDLDRTYNWKIRYNILSDFTQLIYFHTNDGGIHEDIEIYGNVLYNNHYGTVGGDSPGIAMYNGKNIFIHHNTCGWLGPANSGYRCLQLFGNFTNLKIRNNIAYESYFVVEPNNLSVIDSDYNFFSRPRPDNPAYPEGSHSRYSVDPQFENYQRHTAWDFRLKSTSPVLDAGDPNVGSVMNLPSPFVDRNGTIRPHDIPGVGRNGAGAYDPGAFER